MYMYTVAGARWLADLVVFVGHLNSLPLPLNNFSDSYCVYVIKCVVSSHLVIMSLSWQTFHCRLTLFLIFPMLALCNRGLNHMGVSGPPQTR